MSKIHVESVKTTAERDEREERHFAGKTKLHLYRSNVVLKEARVIGTARDRIQIASSSTHDTHFKKKEYISERRLSQDNEIKYVQTMSKINV